MNLLNEERHNLDLALAEINEYSTSEKDIDSFMSLLPVGKTRPTHLRNEYESLIGCFESRDVRNFTASVWLSYGALY